MKIVICNKYFFLNGGTEKYLYDLMQQLTLVGHIPVPFSVNYAGSWGSPYSTYFLNPPSAPDQAHLGNIRVTPINLMRFLDRSIYSFAAKTYLERLLNDIGTVDIAYLLNIYNYMSPSIIHTFRKHNIPVVVHVGDYHLICPSYTLLRNGRPCTLCIHGAYYHGVRYRCVKHRYLVSAVRAAAMYIQRWLSLYHLVKAFIVPCQFMKEKLVAGGFPEERIHLIKYPVVNHGTCGTGQKKNYIIYFGRISYEKGLDTLIQAYQKLSPSVDLVIIGRSYDGEQERLQKLILPSHAQRIQFLGFKTGAELSQWIAEALLSVVPSRWYDNAPLSVYESFLHQTPVVAAGIGGIPEQVTDGVNGKLFAPDSEQELQEALRWMLNDLERLREMGEAGQNYVTQQLTIEKHTNGLLNLFKNV